MEDQERQEAEFVEDSMENSIQALTADKQMLEEKVTLLKAACAQRDATIVVLDRVLKQRGEHNLSLAQELEAQIRNSAELLEDYRKAALEGIRLIFEAEKDVTDEQIAERSKLVCTKFKLIGVLEDVKDYLERLLKWARQAEAQAIGGAADIRKEADDLWICICRILETRSAE